MKLNRVALVAGLSVFGVYLVVSLLLRPTEN